MKKYIARAIQENKELFDAIYRRDDIQKMTDKAVEICLDEHVMTGEDREILKGYLLGSAREDTKKLINKQIQWEKTKHNATLAWEAANLSPVEQAKEPNANDILESFRTRFGKPNNVWTPK